MDLDLLCLMAEKEDDYDYDDGDDDYDYEDGDDSGLKIEEEVDHYLLKQLELEKKMSLYWRDCNYLKWLVMASLFL